MLLILKEVLMNYMFIQGSQMSFWKFLEKTNELCVHPGKPLSGSSIFTATMQSYRKIPLCYLLLPFSKKKKKIYVFLLSYKDNTMTMYTNENV